MAPLTGYDSVVVFRSGSHRFGSALLARPLLRSRYGKLQVSFSHLPLDSLLLRYQLSSFKFPSVISPFDRSTPSSCLPISHLLTPNFFYKS